MALTITVNGGGTFTASMEEGPVSFSASLAAVGPAGPAGAAGDPGVVAATAPVTYDSGTQTVGIDTAYFVRSPEVAPTDGQILAWDEALARPDWIANEARTLFIVARNSTGTTIPKRSVVYISGAQGNRPRISLAQADDATEADGVIGVTAEAIANNSKGRVITAGLLESVDTSDFDEGDKLYLSDSVAGGLTDTRPVQPAHSVAIGIVTRSNNAQGQIEINIEVGGHLEYLHDVLLTSEANLDLLSWDASTSLWKNKSFATLGLLTSATAASTYQTIAGMSAYLTTASAASTYLTITDAASTYQTQSGMSAYLTTSAAASTYLTQSAASSDYLSKAGNLSGLASNATARTNLDVYSKSESDALVPAASTTVAGKVELATDAEAVAGTSSSLAVTPAANLYAAIRASLVPLRSSNTSAAANGASSLTDAGHFGLYVISGSASGGYGVRRFPSQANSALSTIGSSYGVVNFSKPIKLTGKIQSGGVNTSTHANATVRYLFGKVGTAVAGDLTSRGFGIKFAQGSALVLTVHNGSTLTDVTSSYTPSANQFFEVDIHSDGAGNVTAYVNGSSVATTTAGPTGNSAQYNGSVHFEIENTAVPSGNPGAAWVGGWLHFAD